MTAAYDALVIGGGLFGCHAALYLARAGRRVLLIEQSDQLIGRASIVNQARLHAGYHYPRSVATARGSDRYVERFATEFADCINRDFQHYYAIARRGSLTDPAQFERFCRFLGIPCERAYDHPAFDYDQLAAVYATREYSFDPPLLAREYRKRIAAAGVAVELGSTVVSQEEIAGGRRVVIQGCRGKRIVTTRLVVNATYAAINVVNRQFAQPEIPLMHEIAEMAFVEPGAALSGAALTVMDGPFCSLMPYGKTGLHSLSSVAYTHQRVHYGAQPRFSICQSQNPACTPTRLADCSNCKVRPKSNFPKMRSQLSRFLTNEVAKTIRYRQSRFTIKAKLRANHIDDGRPTEVRLTDRERPFVCLFAGKINNVYAMEEPLDRLLQDLDQ